MTKLRFFIITFSFLFFILSAPFSMANSCQLKCGTHSPVIDYLALYKIASYKVRIENPAGNVEFYPGGRIKRFSAYNIDDCRVEIRGVAPNLEDGWQLSFNSGIDGGEFELWANGLPKKAVKRAPYCQPGLTSFTITKTRPGYRTVTQFACEVAFDPRGNFKVLRWASPQAE